MKAACRGSVSGETSYWREIALLILTVYLTFVGGTVYGVSFLGPRVLTLGLWATVFAWWLLDLIRRRRPFPATPLDKPLAAYLAAHLAATIASINPRFSLELLPNVFLYVLLYYLVVDLLRRGWPAALWVKTTLMTGTIVCLFGLLEYTSWYFGLPLFPFKQGWWEIGGLANPIPPQPYRLSYTLNEHSTPAAYLVLIIPLALGLAVATRSLWTRANAVGWLAMAFLVMTLTFSRGGWLGLAAGLSAFVLLQILARAPAPALPRWLATAARRKPILAGAAILLVAILGLCGGFFLRGYQGRTSSIAMRLSFWQYALQMARDYPLFGTGLGTFGQALLQYRSPEDSLYDLFGVTHSVYLQAAANLGLFGLLSLLWLGLALGRRAWQNWRRTASPRHRTLFASCLAGLVGFAVHGLVDNFYPVILYYVVTLAAIATVGWHPRPVEHQQRRTVSSRLVLAGLSLLVAASGWFIYVRYRFDRAVALAEAGRWPEAAPAMERLRTIDPGLVLIDLQLGLIYGNAAHDTGETAYLDRAIRWYERGLARLPVHPLAHANLAALYHRKGWTERAIAEMQTALAREPHNPTYHLNLGLYYEELGRDKQAVDEYALVLANDPTLAASGFWQRSPFRRRRWPDVLRRAGTAPAFPSPHENVIHFQRGRLAYFSGDVDQAVAEFRQVLATDQGPEAHYGLGQALLARNGPDPGDEALTYLSRAIELRPAYAEAYAARGALHLQRGHIPQARRDLKTAVFLQPEDIWPHYYLGRMAHREGDWPTAIHEYRQALYAVYPFHGYDYLTFNRGGINNSTVPQLAIIIPTAYVAPPYLELGQLYEERGLTAEARAVYRRLLYYAPDCEPVRQRLQRLEPPSGEEAP